MGTFPTQGSYPDFLHWQADSLPLVPPGKPTHLFNPWFFLKELDLICICKSTGVSWGSQCLGLSLRSPRFVLRIKRSFWSSQIFTIPQSRAFSCSWPLTLLFLILGHCELVERTWTLKPETQILFISSSTT